MQETDIDNPVKGWTDFLLPYKFAIDEVRTKLNILNEEFQIGHDYNPIEHIKTRLKKPSSIIKKLEKKHKEVTYENARQHVRDIAGVRVICSFITDIHKVLEMICSQDDVKVIQIKDYVKNPKPSGYQSIHAIIEIPVYLSSGPQRVKVEVQIRTIAMEFWASLEHKIYYKYQKEIPASTKQRLKETADIVFALDSKMLALREEIEKF
ncbi:GTP pyrophosphokinase family protein [Peptococcaceae bacterium 1198_IL3148]